MFHGYDKIIDLVEAKRRDQEVGQSSFFDIMDEDASNGTGGSFDLPQVDVWGRGAQLTFEKEVLGFYLSDHPLNGYEQFALTDGSLLDLKSPAQKKCP